MLLVEVEGRLQTVRVCDGAHAETSCIGGRHQDALGLRAAAALEQIAPWSAERRRWRQPARIDLCCWNSAMARANVELVERVYDRLLAGDDALFFESLAPDVEWDETGGSAGEVFPDGAVLRGVPELRRFLRDWVGSWEEIRWYPRDFQDAGNDVIVSVDIWGRGQRSGVEVQHTRHQVWTLRDGKVVRFKSFLTRDEALAAATVRK